MLDTNSCNRAGVSGLTTAYLLSQDPANKVTVLAKHMPGDYDVEYASPWAGANYMPYVDQTYNFESAINDFRVLTIPQSWKRRKSPPSLGARYLASIERNHGEVSGGRYPLPRYVLSLSCRNTDPSNDVQAL